MISCDNANQLFDRYLDGELPAGLQTELHAHRLNCSCCQNDLAIMEACGDVIGMDACEPKPSASFTDRVILARRAQRPRTFMRWSKVATWAGGSLAAAAAIAFAVVSLRPTPKAPAPERITLSMIQAQPKPLRELLIADRGTPMTAGGMRDLDATPEMATANVIYSVLDPIVSSAQRSLTDTHRATSELSLLLDLGLSSTMERLADTPGESAHAAGNARPSTSFAPELPTPLEVPAAASSGSEPIPEAL